MGTNIIIQKTKYLCIESETQNLQLDNSEKIEACENRQYFGFTFDKMDTRDREIRTRIIQTSNGCPNGTLWNKNITKYKKYNMYKSLVPSSLLYESKKLRNTERNRRMLEATEKVNENITSRQSEITPFGNRRNLRTLSSQVLGESNSLGTVNMR